MRVWRAPPRSLPRLDRAIIIVTGALVVITSVKSQPNVSTSGRAFDVVAVTLIAAGFACAAIALRAPAIGALGTLVLIMLWYGLGYRSGLINLPFLIAFYLLGATGDRFRQILVGGLAVGSSLIGMLVAGSESTASAAAAVGWILAAILFGEVTHNRRALIAELHDRAERIAAERDREAERRVAEARLAIAHDVHDVLAHTVSVMNVQAGVAQDALERGEDGAEGALQTIRAAGRDALGEIHALVSVLRKGPDSADTAPVPRLDRLEELAAATRAAGIRVDLAVEVPTDAVSELAELTVYRVVQEALTNAVRHARTSRVSVAVRCGEHDLLVSVRNDGVPSTTDAGDAGFGLRGMRERVQAMGGTLATGPTVEGGWLVQASIPVERASPS